MVIGRDEAEVAAKRERLADFIPQQGALIGTPDQLIAKFREYEAIGCRVRGLPHAGLAGCGDGATVRGDGGEGVRVTSAEAERSEAMTLNIAGGAGAGSV
ncbi:MAG: hypothetical protein U0841_23520 [Chloroflexia bacterium]